MYIKRGNGFFSPFRKQVRYVIVMKKLLRKIKIRVDVARVCHILPSKL